MKQEVTVKVVDSTRNSNKTVTNLNLTTKDNVTLFVSFSDAVIIEAKRVICFRKKSRVTLSFVVSSSW